jgi:sugar phosphate isomerase/epimerase
MITRRRFINGSAAAAVATILSPGIVSCLQKNKLINLGFISGIIGKELQGDWKKVLEQIHEFGYTEIETGNYLGDSAADFVSFLKHTGITTVAGALEFSTEDVALRKNFTLINSLQMKYAVVYWPWFTGGPFNLEDCKKSADRLNFLGKQCKNHGLTLCWHNHNKEFTPMEIGLPFDFLMDNTDKDLVSCELDLYWVKKGGGDPLALMKKYTGRFPILHIKDMAPGKAMDFECPGSGIIDFPPLFREAHYQGIKHYMVERDNVQDGLACLRSAAEYLKKLTF